jgi:hypothetical protein
MVALDDGLDEIRLFTAAGLEPPSARRILGGKVASDDVEGVRYTCAIFGWDCMVLSPENLYNNDILIDCDLLQYKP